MKAKKYKQIEEKLLHFLEIHPDQIYRSRELAKHLNIANQDYQGFKRIVRQLAEEKKILRHKGNRYGKSQKPTIVTGILHVKTQGYGFVIRDDGGEDVFVSQRNMNTALHHDKVKVLLWAQPVGKLPEGKVVEILERGHKKIVGIFQEAKTYNYVIPDELKITRDVLVHEKNRGKALSGQKVVVEITSWGDSRRMPEGRVVEVLGYPHEKGVDILSVAHGFDLPLTFPKTVEEEVKKLPQEIPSSFTKDRLDLRNKLIFTIDPEEAKDFDDAVSLEHVEDGSFLLGVHIADVSKFVPPASALDREALRRGTSVYLVDRVIPMLPEELSNNLCSLKPDVDRLTYSVLMKLTPEGILEDYTICESIIRSKYRLTYKQVQKIIDESKTKIKKEKDKSENRDLKKTILDMVKLSRKLNERWHEIGRIDFDAPEAEVILDEKGQPVDLKIKERTESHKLIEAFMLLANQTVAEHIHHLRQKTGHKFPFVYRVHEKPRGEKLEEFVRFVRALGYQFNPGKKITPKKFQLLLQEVTGTKHEIIIEDIALRTMMKAIYSTRNTGHFGLAFRNYTHFTSPIRRYPDLTVHRLMKAYSKNEPEHPQLVASLSKICEISTEQEIKAQEAERESIRAKQVEFMEDRVGDEFDGVISGVTSFGIFVEIPEYLVEGLVHISDLKDDYYIYDEKNYRLVGKERNRIYTLGEPVRVQVVRVLREMRKIDFILSY